MTNYFKKGDAVRLIHGHSPTMTVLEPDNYVNFMVLCCWFDVTSNYRTQLIPRSILKEASF